jgi:hypothetical protein
MGPGLKWAWAQAGISPSRPAPSLPVPRRPQAQAGLVPGGFWASDSQIALAIRLVEALVEDQGKGQHSQIALPCNQLMIQSVNHTSEAEGGIITIPPWRRLLALINLR